MRTRAAQPAPKGKPMGRRPIYGKTMTARISVRLSAEQSHAIAKWCTKHRCSLLAVLRTSVLETIGELPAGSVNGIPRTVRGARVKGATSIGVPFSEGQAAAIWKFAESRGVDPSGLIRESALVRVGADHLGAIGTFPALETAVREGAQTETPRR